MGIVPALELKILGPLNFKTMLELGNKKNERGTYKHYFTKRGIEHTSVDWNGKDGALPLDLRYPLDLPVYDVVTNFGCTEHIDGQKEVFENIHKHGKLMVHVIPLIGNWIGHAKYPVTIEFMEKLAEANNYVVEDIYIDGKDKKKLVCARFYRTNDEPFVWN